MKLLIINGPNINMLGIREKGIYGDESYEALLSFIKKVCDENGIEAEFFQSNHEGAIVDRIQEAYGKVDGIVINPAAYTHTSVAILDALKAVSIPCCEVHLSNIYEREEFRHHSYISMAAEKTFYGEGFKGYEKAVMYLKDRYGKT
ncbi:MAG TPA: type II 3-dehydroquinate dehydratase [Candidatus Avilachnospira avistercoris]|nr:type II 3-dehydroquinate dehydratase [Candidatus Avilachnospira avistercoris]